MADRINFINKINDSVQVGDELFYGDTVQPLGAITAIGEKYVEVDDATGAVATDFFSFKKVNHINSYSKSGTKGYYASVKMSTEDTSKTKLFALGSEVAVSSK
mgnify:FL=1|tara:strand:+ start:6679 stop:6987 length:309 start_codon:yes stop_codon:yes gene_type:complete